MAITFQINHKTTTIKMFNNNVQIGRLEWTKYDLKDGLDYFGLDQKWASENVKDQTVLYINIVILNPNMRGVGYGNQLMKYFFEQAESQMIKTIFLESLAIGTLIVKPEEQTKLNKFYEKLGFKFIRQYPDLSGLMFRKQ